MKSQQQNKKPMKIKKSFNRLDFDKDFNRREQRYNLNTNFNNNSYVNSNNSNGLLESPSTSSKQLFDPKRDDPVRFSVLKRNQDASSTPSTSSFRTFSTSNDSDINERQRDKERERRKRRDARSQSSKDSNSRGSSGSGSKKDKSKQDDSGSAFLTQLKRAYKDIMDTENKLSDERRFLIDFNNQQPKIGLFGKETDSDDAIWFRLSSKHKSLADAYHNFLSTSLAPHTPTSLHALPQKYNIPTRLWQNAFHGLLEKMRASLSLPNNLTRLSNKSTMIDNKVLDHLSDFVYHAYAFYTNLLEEPCLSPFKASWIEALGDLARYRMAVASIESNYNPPPGNFTTPKPPTHNLKNKDENEDDLSDDIVASVGLPALKQGGFDIDERDQWRLVAREWYGQGLRDMPGTGRLQHHLGILCRGTSESDESLKGLYHFSKALTTSHPYSTARESLLSLFDPDLQLQRAKLDSKATDLFVYLHGLLFTKIELDNFDQCHERLLEKLKSERGSIPDVYWIMFAVINITSLLQYGSDEGIIKKTSANTDEKRLNNSNSNSNLTINSQQSSPIPPVPALPQAIMIHSNTLSSSPKSNHSFDNLSNNDDDVFISINNNKDNDQEVSATSTVFEQAQNLTFSLFEMTLEKPTLSKLPGSSINPYIIIILTYLTTVCKQSSICSLLEKRIPWQKLMNFFSSLPMKILIESGAKPELPQPHINKLVSGLPLPEDWCLRGMEWVGRRVYERGFWKARSNHNNNNVNGNTLIKGDNGASYSGSPPPIPGSNIQSEMDVLTMKEFLNTSKNTEEILRDGVIEIDEEDLNGLRLNDDEYSNNNCNIDSPLKLSQRRLLRVGFSGVMLSKIIKGFEIINDDNGRPKFIIGDELSDKIEKWKVEQEMMEEEELKRFEELYNNKNESDENSSVYTSNDSISSFDSEMSEDDEQIRDLRIRRRELKLMMKEEKENEINLRKRRKENLMNVRSKNENKLLIDNVKSNYTILVFDTNVLLSSIDYVKTFIESQNWTCIIPLAVITELDGLSKTSNALGECAIIATSYIEYAIIKYSKTLKIQTSKNNYLSDLKIRTEDIDKQSEVDGTERNTLDDVILQSAKWQKENWVKTNKSSTMFLLNSPPPSPSIDDENKENLKVILVTYDRNLRLKARANGINVASESDLVKIYNKEFER